jgi:hypothetical protein
MSRTLFSLAGFQVITDGRFWVIAEGFEGHLSYDFKMRRLWASLDGNFWWGGVTTLSGVSNPVTRQTGSRVGGTVSFPFTKHQSVKVAYSNGTYIRFGGDYQSLSVGWQYSWLGRPN